MVLEEGQAHLKSGICVSGIPPIEHAYEWWVTLPRRMLGELLFVHVSPLNKAFCPITNSLVLVWLRLKYVYQGGTCAFYLEAFAIRSRGRFSRRGILLKGVYWVGLIILNSSNSVGLNLGAGICCRMTTFLISEPSISEPSSKRM